jgi:hypothetical protein
MEAAQLRLVPDVALMLAETVMLISMTGRSLLVFPLARMYSWFCRLPPHAGLLFFFIPDCLSTNVLGLASTTRGPLHAQLRLPCAEGRIHDRAVREVTSRRGR